MKPRRGTGLNVSWESFSNLGTPCSSRFSICTKVPAKRISTVGTKGEAETEKNEIGGAQPPNSQLNLGPARASCNRMVCLGFCKQPVPCARLERRSCDDLSLTRTTTSTNKRNHLLQQEVHEKGELFNSNGEAAMISVSL